MSSKDDVLIACLKYIKAGGLEGRSFNDLVQHITPIYPSLDDAKIFRDCFWRNVSSVSKGTGFGHSLITHEGTELDRDEPYQLNEEAYWKLLEYVELAEARKSSKTAFYMSFSALCVSAFLAIVSIIISLQDSRNYWDL